MTDSSKAPERLKPFYEVEPGKEIRLIEEKATLKQGGVEAKGKVRITQQLSPVGLYWDFMDANCESFVFGEVDIASRSFDAKGRVSSVGKNRAGGSIEGKVRIGTEHKLDKVTFHLPDYADLKTDSEYEFEFKKGPVTTQGAWSEVLLEFDGWSIKLQPYQDIYALRVKARVSRNIVLSGVGEIRKKDGTMFKRKKVEPILDGLRIFLSFSFAGWCPTLLVVGSNDVAEKSCELWGNHLLGPNPYLTGWLDGHHGQHLSEAFPGFMRRWKKSNWREPLELAVNWLIEAANLESRAEGAIAFGQIPLEMLASMVFVDDTTIIDSNEFEGISAASKIQMLLAHCGIPLEVPHELKTLKTIANERQKKSGKAITGPKLATEVRNTIIHPKEKNRKVLNDWKKEYAVSIIDIRSETQQLFEWYVTLVILYIIEYRGEYSNRLAQPKLGDVEQVSWALDDEI